MKYGEKVRYIRDKVMGLSQGEFADKLGVTQQYISILETSNGDKRFGRKKEKDLIESLGLPPGFFDNDDVGVAELDNDIKILYARIPGAKEIGLTWENVRLLLEPHVILYKRKLNVKSSD